MFYQRIGPQQTGSQGWVVHQSASSRLCDCKVASGLDRPARAQSSLRFLSPHFSPGVSATDQGGHAPGARWRTHTLSKDPAPFFQFSLGTSLAQRGKPRQRFGHPPDSLPAPSRDSPEAACAACPDPASQCRPFPAWRPRAGWTSSSTRSSSLLSGAGGGAMAGMLGKQEKSF